MLSKAETSDNVNGNLPFKDEREKSLETKTMSMHVAIFKMIRENVISETWYPFEGQ